MTDYTPDFSNFNFPPDDHNNGYPTPDYDAREKAKYKVYTVNNKEYKVPIEEFEKAITEDRPYAVLIDDKIVYMNTEELEEQKRIKQIYNQVNSQHYNKNFHRTFKGKRR